MTRAHALMVTALTVLCLSAAGGPPKDGNQELFDRIDQGFVDDRSIQALRAAAESGSGPAALRLGYLYLTGSGMEINLPLAYRWYCAAALRNVPFAIDHASKILYRMGPAARVHAEDLVATTFSTSDLARLQAMTPASIPTEEANPGADKGSMVK